MLSLWKIESHFSKGSKVPRCRTVVFSCDPTRRLPSGSAGQSYGATAWDPADDFNNHGPAKGEQLEGPEKVRERRDES